MRKQYTNNCLTKKNENSVSDMWSLLKDIYYYENNYATKQSNQSQIHTQSWKIAQKVSKNAILKKKNCQKGKKWMKNFNEAVSSILKKERKKWRKNRQNINYSSELLYSTFFWLLSWIFSYLFYLLLDVIYCNFLAQN